MATAARQILEAADEYNRALAIDPSLAEAWLNIAALHHLHGDVNASIRPYMVRNNSQFNCPHQPGSKHDL